MHDVGLLQDPDEAAVRLVPYDLYAVIDLAIGMYLICAGFKR